MTAPLPPAATGRTTTTAAYHATCLALAGSAIALALMLEVLPDERVGFRGLTQYPLPHICFSRAALGVPCPGCGLTRSFIHLAHGDWQASWRVHHVGWLLFAVVCLQIPYRAAWLSGVVRRPPRAPAVEWFAVSVVVLLVANWVWRICQ